MPFAVVDTEGFKMGMEPKGTQRSLDFRRVLSPAEREEGKFYSSIGQIRKRRKGRETQMVVM